MSLEEGYETVLFRCPKINVYQIPRIATGTTFRTDSWGPLQPIFTGALRVISRYGQGCCEIRIEESESGELFAAAPYIGFHVAQKAQDSSRYYQLRVVHEKKVAYLGIGFEDREASFDFQVALSDHVRHIEAAREESVKAAEPAKDYSIREGEMLNVNFGAKGRKTEAEQVETGSETSTFIPFLAPPPPSTNTSRSKSTTLSDSTTANDDDFGDFQ